ncbi:MAG: single-stranded DNA-binding protein [Holosporales bacterium]|jgi:single-strand DNA-binding protein|nr:single-stranded DNA-binding protein [Holosporales bacterium]
MEAKPAGCGRAGLPFLFLLESWRFSEGEEAMAGSINKAILIGNLGRDPEMRHTQDGSKVANFTLATSESWKDKASGGRKERTEWHRVVVFDNALADIVERYLHKGSKVYIEGQIRTRRWQDANGVERYTTEIVLSRFRGELTILDSRSGSEGGMPREGVPPEAETEGGEAAPLADFDDDIPF